MSHRAFLPCPSEMKIAETYPAPTRNVDPHQHAPPPLSAALPWKEHPAHPQLHLHLYLPILGCCQSPPLHPTKLRAWFTQDVPASAPIGSRLAFLAFSHPLFLFSFHLFASDAPVSDANANPAKNVGLYFIHRMRHLGSMYGATQGRNVSPQGDRRRVRSLLLPSSVPCESRASILAPSCC